MYFSQAAAEEPLLVQLHRTPLYTVFYDHVLSRCVLHSGHTWGETGGGGGGTGVGVAVFACDPSRIAKRLDELEEMIESGRKPALPSKRKQRRKARPERSRDPASQERPAGMGTPAGKPENPPAPPDRAEPAEEPSDKPTQPVIR